MKRLIFLLCLPLLLTPDAFAENSLLKHIRRNAPPEVTLTLTPEGALVPGQPARVIATLSRKGQPLAETDLKTVHTQKFHLLIVDPTFTDYHHVHPEPGPTPGSYRFTFTPKLEGGYRAWADIITADVGEQQFIYANMGQPAEPIIDAQPSHNVEVDGYRFTLSFDETPRAEESSMLSMRVSDASGKPVESLEPIMGAFGHMVGFYDDYQTILHAHPVGKEPRSDVERGGPSLIFHIEPGKPGFVKIFMQARIDGKDIYAPLGIKVDKASLSE